MIKCLSPLYIPAVISLIISSSTYSLDPLFEDLPATYREAARAAEDGLIEPTVWTIIRKYYAEPLNVPQGELRYLSDALPDMESMMPSKPGQLSKYEPWTPDKVSEFFEDFPALMRFRPILSFETKNAPHFANVRFLSRINRKEDEYRHSARFILSPAGPILADGTVSFENSFARWQRRLLSVKIPGSGRIHAGNFSYSMNNGLFFGLFPSQDRSYNDMGKNWIYGSTASWNGVSMESGIGRKSTVSALIHKQPTETIIGAKAEIQPFPSLSIYAGGSRLVLTGADDLDEKLYAVHGGLSLQKKGWSADLHTGIDPLSPYSVPLTLKLGRSAGRSSVSGAYIRIPEGFYAPRSRLANSLSNRLDFEDSITTDISAFEISYSDSIKGTVRQAVRGLYLIGNHGNAFDASVKITGKIPLQYTLSYAFYASGFDYTRHLFRILLRHPPKEDIRLSTELSYLLKPHVCSRLSSRLLADIDVFSMMTVSPFITFSASTNPSNGRDFAFGLKQSIFLFNKTFGEITCTIPITRFEDEGIELNAQTCFNF